MAALDMILEGKDRRIHAVAPSASVLSAVESMCAARVGALLVMEAATLRGVFSERDLMTRVVLTQRDATRTIVRDVMTTMPYCVGPHVSPNEAMSVMTTRRVRHLPVVLDGHVVGIVSIGDLLRWTLDSREQELAIREREVEDLRGYVVGSYPG